MNTDSKKHESSRIIWAFVFALAMIAAAFLFKGKPSLYWIESALLVGALTFVILKPRRPVSAR
jgi:hypothetical protein